MNENEVTNLTLLKLFRQCSHLQHRMDHFHGQGYLLVLLSQQEVITQSELTKKTERRSATLSEQLEIMERAGLITREKNAADKRNIDIRLTEKGKETALQAKKMRAATADAFFSVLDKEEKLQLNQILQKIKETLRESGHDERSSYEENA